MSLSLHVSSNDLIQYIFVSLARNKKLNVSLINNAIFIHIFFINKII